jgi:RND superfamily putative drug exporter
VFAKLGRFSVNHPWSIIAGWIIATVALVMFAPTIADITKTEQSDFLPRKYESIKALDLGASAFTTGGGDTSASIVVKRGDGGKLTNTDQQKVEALAQELTDAKIPSVRGIAVGPQTLSPNERIQLVNIDFSGSPEDQKIVDAVGKIRDIAGTRLAGTDLQEGVTGDAALSVDNQDQFDRALAIVGIATIVLIIVLLLIVYRSPIAALLPIVTILAIVLPTSGAVIASVGKLFGLNADSSLEIVRTIVL